MKTTLPPLGRAVLLALESAPSLGPITAHNAAFLLPLAGKSLGDRILGQLSDLGISRLTVFMSGDTSAVASFLGDGSRWGIKVQLIDLRNPEQIVDRLKLLDLQQPFLLGDLFRLPAIDKNMLNSLRESGPAIIKDEEGGHTGWAYLSPDILMSCELHDADAFFTWLDESVDAVRAAGPVLKCLTADDIITSTTQLLNQTLKGHIVPGASGESGIWIGAGSIIHPTVKIEPPVWIGENCRIDQGVQLGPNTCISDNCVLGKCSVVVNSIVLPSTCVGYELKLKDVLADRNYLSYADLNQTIAIPDEFLLSPNQPIQFSLFVGTLIGRMVAMLFLIPALPFIGFFWLIGRALGQRSPLIKKECVKLPAAEDPFIWKTFFLLRWQAAPSSIWERITQSRLLRIIISIPGIAFGRLHWVGLAPRTVEETKALPEDWRMLYLGAKAGLFQLAEIDCRLSKDFSTEQQFSSEAYYAATRKVSLDMSILLRSMFPKRAPKPRTSKSAIITLKSGSQTLEQLHGFLKEQLYHSDIKLTKEQCDAITTAVHEAVANVIRHAYDYKPELPIQLHMLKTPECVEFGIYDRGVVFSPDQIPDPDFSADAEGGFGWFLINNIADKVSFSRSGQWNHLALTFNKHKQEKHHETY